LKKEDIIIREAKESDIPGLSRNAIICAKETPYLTYYGNEADAKYSDLEKEKEWFEKQKENGVLFVAEDTAAGEIVGSASISVMNRPSGYSHRCTLGIEIQKKAWGLWIGSRMMEKCIEAARNKGCTQIELKVFTENDRAVKLYKNCGFAIMGSIPCAVFREGHMMSQMIMIDFL
jgi:putative acetyltransferase